MRLSTAAIQAEAMELLAQVPQREFYRPAYVLFMLAAFAAFVLVKRFQQQPESLHAIEPFNRFLIGWSAFVGGAFGGKIPFVLFEPQAIWSLEAWLADGKTITTALMGAYLAVEFSKWLLGVRTKTGDQYALPLAAALAIGRLGCFFNGCCWGTPTELPWGVDFGLGPVHPTQLYEVIFHALAAVVLWSLPGDAEWLRDQRLKLYLIAYCLFRFLTEWLRPEPQVLIGLTFYQLAVAAFAIGLSIQWWVDQQFKLRLRQQQSDSFPVEETILTEE